MSVHILASSAPHQGSDQAASVQCTASPCCSGLACPTLVSGPTGTVHQPPPVVTGHSSESPQTTRVGQITPGPGQAAALCLGAVRRSLSKAGFSREMAERIAVPKAPSTIYD